MTCRAPHKQLHQISKIIDFRDNVVYENIPQNLGRLKTMAELIKVRTTPFLGRFGFVPSTQHFLLEWLVTDFCNSHLRHENSFGMSAGMTRLHLNALMDMGIARETIKNGEKYYSIKYARLADLTGFECYFT